MKWEIIINCVILLIVTSVDMVYHSSHAKNDWGDCQNFTTKLLIAEWELIAGQNVSFNTGDHIV